MIEIVSATRLSEVEFWQRSALGVSLRRMAPVEKFAAHIAFENTRGLPEIYNHRLRATTICDVLVFVHDDVWIEDAFFVSNVVRGFQSFDVIGVAGNRKCQARQPAWPFIDEAFTWDASENLSGAVGHGQNPLGAIARFGPTPAPCELLDGVLLAVNKPRLLANTVEFDPQFKFHFYDLDFCRQARAKGLRLGTWPISITHQSGGSFGSPAWRAQYATYLAKWGS